MKSKCLRGKKPIEVKVDENQTVEKIECLICILAKKSLLIVLTCYFFIWRYRDSVWMPYLSCQDGDVLWGEVMTFRKILPVCAQYLFCVKQFKLFCCIFQVFISLQKYFKFQPLMSVFSNYKAMTSFFFYFLLLKKHLSRNQSKDFYAMLALTWCSNFLKVQNFFPRHQDESLC